MNIEAKIKEVQLMLTEAARLRAEAVESIERIKDIDVAWSLYTQLMPTMQVHDWIIRFDIDGFDDVADYLHGDYSRRGSIVSWEMWFDVIEDMIMDAGDGEPPVVDSVTDWEGFRKELMREIIKSGTRGYCYDW